MPALHEGSAVTGELRPELAKRWGIAGKVVVAGGGGDNAASACGVGVVPAGHRLPFAWHVRRALCLQRPVLPDPETAVHAFCHAVPNTWHQMGVILSAAGALEWLAGVFATDAAELTRPLE